MKRWLQQWLGLDIQKNRMDTIVFRVDSKERELRDKFTYLEFQLKNLAHTQNRIALKIALDDIKEKPHE